MISSIPFYFLLKLFLVVWLFYPGTLGAIVVYENVILKVPFFVFNKDGSLSSKINELASSAQDTVEKMTKLE